MDFFSVGIIKPDAVERSLVGQVLARVEELGMLITAMQMVVADVFLVNEHYAEHRGKDFFRDLCDSMIGKKIIPFTVVRAEGQVWHPSDVVTRLRNAVGIASDHPPEGTIRWTFQLDRRRNSIHASDSHAAAIRELKIWFPDL